MTNTRTYIRLLRHLGVALIFAPEPFTTPFGVAFIMVARHLSKQNEAKVNNRLRNMVQYYLEHTSHFSDYVDGESDGPSPVKRPRLSEEPPILGQITGSRSSKPAPSVHRGRSDIRDATANRARQTRSLSRHYKYDDGLADTSGSAEKVTHHTLDMEWLSRRYETANGAVAHASWTTTSGSVDGVTHHSINMGMLSGHYGPGSAGQTNAKSHAISMARRRQGHGAAPTHTTVRRALRDNNHYYDMLSRKNVIGGY